jgi:hypothetical protein
MRRGLYVIGYVLFFVAVECARFRRRLPLRADKVVVE